MTEKLSYLVRIGLSKIRLGEITVAGVAWWQDTVIMSGISHQRIASMAGRNAPPADTDAPKHQLNPAQIKLGIERLDERLGDLEAFDVDKLVKGRSSELTALETAITETLIRCFGENTSAYRRYSGAGKLRYSPSVISSRSQVDYRTPTARNVGDAIALLQQAKKALGDDLVDYQQLIASTPPQTKAPIAPCNEVFVVHGHDEAALQGLARFLEKLGLEAIVLREQVDQGRTIIEKFEACANGVGFAVVLLTPDDLGGAVSAAEPNARARQNVIFELGYFAGKLGRGKVCLLRKGSVEIPSDLYGVIYTEMDSAEGWHTKLVREMKAAGLQFDANRLWD
ncbi:TPA: TIR domain-containing protein [Pseudomonas putida]